MSDELSHSAVGGNQFDRVLGVVLPLCLQLPQSEALAILTRQPEQRDDARGDDRQGYVILRLRRATGEANLI